MSDIFISYSSEDQATARHFADAFEAEGFSVWWDAALRSGQTYDQVIEEALREAKAVVVLWSPNSVASRWVRAEATEADRLQTLVPAIIEDCKLPIVFELTHCENLSGWSGDKDSQPWRNLLTAIAELTASTSETPTLELPNKPSVAVLPFTDMTGTGNQDYFVEGMMVEIIGALSLFPSLFVIASGTSMAYRGDSRAPAVIAKELGVRYILLGSVRKAGNRVRIAVELLDEGARTPIWSQRFDGELEDVFALQDSVANGVASQIEPNIQAAEVRRANDRPTEDQDAYDFYLRGRGKAAFETESEQALRDAIELFDEAIARDPEFAVALAWASNTHLNIALLHSEDAEPEKEIALELARRAVKAGSHDYQVMAWSAYTYLQCGYDISTVITMVEQAVALNPGDSLPRYSTGWTYNFAGRPQAAIAEFDIGLRLDPRSPYRQRMEGGIGWALYHLHRFEEAIPLLRVCAEHDSSLEWLFMRTVASCYAHLGRFDEARKIPQALDPSAPIENIFFEQFRDAEFRALLRQGIELLARLEK
jgi:adenylate cyclase